MDSMGWFKKNVGSFILTISASAEMTFPSVVSDLLIFAPSFSLVPVAPVESALSEPAKSTRLILLTCKVRQSEKQSKVIVCQ